EFLAGEATWSIRDWRSCAFNVMTNFMLVFLAGIVTSTNSCKRLWNFDTPCTVDIEKFSVSAMSVDEASG
ncbi:hypothetical protein ACLKA7_017694, partial [Drosophila subpalustris]